MPELWSDKADVRRAFGAFRHGAFSPLMAVMVGWATCSALIEPMVIAQGLNGSICWSAQPQRIADTRRRTQAQGQGQGREAGESRMPKSGYRIPAALGIPRPL